jgi:replicative DNA helicase
MADSEFFDTVELERAFLKLITKSKIHANLNIHKGKDDFFTDPSRKYIYATAKRAYADTKSTLTKDLFEYELKHKVDPSDQVFYEAEWNFVENIDTPASPDAIIDRLMEADTGRKIMSTMEKVVDLIGKGDVASALSSIKSDTMRISMSKDEQPIRRLLDFEHRKERILDKKRNPEKYTGVKTGFPTFDKKTGGLFKGELTLVAAVTGVGKSTLLKALQWGIVSSNPNVNVLHIANEEYSEQVESKFDSLITEIPYLDFKFGNISDNNLDKWESKMKSLRAGSGMNIGEIYTKEVPAFTDVTLVEQAYRELEAQGVKIDVIMIDHLPHIVPIMKSYGENDERWKAAADCKELARSLQVPVIIPTQAATDVAEKQERGKRAGKMDVYGSKGPIHVSNTFFIITVTGKDNTQIDRPEYERDVYWLVDCKKNRDGSPFSFKAKHHVYIGKVEEVVESGDFTGSGDHTAGEKTQEECADVLQDLDSKLDEVSDTNTGDIKTAESPDDGDIESIREMALNDIEEKPKKRRFGRASSILKRRRE